MSLFSELQYYVNRLTSKLIAAKDAQLVMPIYQDSNGAPTFPIYDANGQVVTDPIADAALNAINGKMLMTDGYLGVSIAGGSASINGPATTWIDGYSGASTVSTPLDSGVAKNTACQLFALKIVNSSASLIYFQMFDSTTVPVDGIAPRMPSIPIESNQFVQIDYGALSPLSMVNGLSWCASSTIATKTLVSPALNALQIMVEVA